MAKRRGDGEGTVFRLKNGRWKAEIKRLGWSATRRSRADVAAELAERLAIESAGTAKPFQSEMLLCDWVSAWLTDVKRDSAFTTWDTYRHMLETHVIPTLGPARLQDLQPMAIRNFLAELSKDYAGTETLQKVYVVLHGCLQAAKRLDLIAANPCEKVTRPKHTRKDIRPFTLDETRLIMREVSAHRLGAAIVLGFHTGLRIGEISGLEWRDVDFTERRLSVERQLVVQRGQTEIKPPKTRAGRRTIDLPEVCVNALRNRQAVAMSEGLAGCEIVFPTKNGQRVQRQNFARHPWKAALKRLAIEERGFHHVRHSFATHALMAGSPIHVVSRILGHSSPSVTLNVYSHLVDTAQSVVMERVAQLFAG